METIANYLIKNKKNLGHWDSLLEEWILSIERFSRITNGDVPYWYNERANVGVLAAAAWRCGRIALEEFQHEKIDVSSNEETDETNQEKWMGRCDLWISNDRSEELIEAKFKWLNLLSERIDEISTDCLGAAVKNAYDTRGNGEIRAIGVAFLPVYAKANKVGNVESLENIIAKNIIGTQKLSTDLVAWCFPKRLRNHIGERYNNYLPGVIMLAKVAK